MMGLLLVYMIVILGVVGFILYLDFGYKRKHKNQPVENVEIIPIDVPEVPVVLQEVILKSEFIPKYLRMTWRPKMVLASRHLKFSIDLMQEENVIDTIHCVSGSALQQRMRTVAESKAKGGEPIPEGYYGIAEILYSAASLTVVLDSLNSNTRKFLIVVEGHSEANDNIQISEADAGKLFSWLKESNPPKLFVVNWSLGTVETQGMGYKSFQEKSKAPAVTKTKARVALEVGHGPYVDRNGVQGFEPGALGEGTTEYAENLYRAGVIRTLLENFGYRVTLIDSQATLSQLGALAEDHDLCVSLHLNAFNKKAQGSETIVGLQATEEDARLARCIQMKTVQALNFPDRNKSKTGQVYGVPRQSLALWHGFAKAKNLKAACLSEAFFIDALSDADSIRKHSHLSAEAIVRGIEAYLDGKG